MAVTEAYTGSQDVSTTEWSLTTDSAGPDVDTTDGAYQCFLDLSPLVKGDAFKFQVYETVGSNQKLVFASTFANAQSAPVWVSPTLMLISGWDMTLVRTAGLDHVIVWSIRSA